MEFEAADDLLNPGYLAFESGYRELSEGKMLVAALTRMPGCRAKMVDWWFSWLGGTEQYKLWHPTDHVFSDWEGRVGGRYIGASHLVHEYLAGDSGPLFKLRISFHDPAETFDRNRYEESGATAICARIGELDAPVSFGRMCHFVRNTDYGCEMRSRFWLGVVESRDPSVQLSSAKIEELRRAKLNQELARRLHQHAVEEMGYLSEILAPMYRRMTLDNTF
ncbi:MAG TPA: hypothetical protein VMU78_03185, partial [Methylocella sp.]|nr:hypothetical protein [Methylocella sp.]